MVIYHTAPIRCFPLLVAQMAGHFTNPYHFRMPIRSNTRADHRFGMLNGVIPYKDGLAHVPRKCRPGNGFPYNVLTNGIDWVEPEQLKDIDFLYGVFDGSLIQSSSDDFVFTVISHPVKHIYDLFQYLEHMQHTASDEERRAEGIVHFAPLVSQGLERFVDRFLDGDRAMQIAGRNFYLIEDVFRFNMAVEYDFIGVEQRIDEVVTILSKLLGFGITTTPRLLSRRSSLAAKTTYRFADLCRKLAPEIAVYEELTSSRPTVSLGGSVAHS